MVPTKKLIENEIYINKITNLLNKLDIIPSEFNNYLLAFVHRSLVNEKPDLSAEHNERLEFLGDAVLELVITHKLFLDYPNKPEGDLTDYRSSIVKGKHLANIAKTLGFNEYLILGKGEELGGGRNNDYLLANCVESFIGAIYLDLGYEEAQKFILKYIYSNLENIINNDLLKDYKSLLQEYTQRVFNITPEYRVLDESGLDHEKNYKSGVFLLNTIIGNGNGSSKKKSQEDAAKDAFLNKEEIKI
ncbi:MAG: ribonuclease III [Candidatus Gracilibacteria bacterium]|nr:ribonuclease III [Candidatus Gracilibacteria bacterium]